MKFGIVERSIESIFKYRGWPTVCKDENGTLFAACSGHRLRHVCPFGKNFLYRSHDGGESWSSPVIINDTPLDDRDAGLCPLGDGRILMTYFNNSADFYINRDKNNPSLDKFTSAAYDVWKSMPEEETRAGSYCMISRDGGDTWGERHSTPVSSPHGPSLLSDGRILYLGRGIDPCDGIPCDGIYACESVDEGASWRVISHVQRHPDMTDTDLMCEPHLLELSDGTLLGAIRVQSHGKGHLFTIYTCTSKDGGYTWSVPTPTGICGSPPHLLLHSSGAVILTYARRAEPLGEYARISLDGGMTWSEETAISPAPTSADCGYPSSAELDDGSVITVYYQRYENDDFCSILYTKWTLDEAFGELIG